MSRETPVIPLGNRSTLQLRSDDELMRLAASGVLSAFEELVKRHQAAVRAFCRRMLGDGAHADDAAQDVFLELWRTSARYEGQGRLRAFLFTCARNRCLKMRRHTRALPAVDQQGRDLSPDQLEALLAVERRRRLDEFVQRLPPKLREAIALRFAAGLDYREIAAVTGAGEETIRSRVFLGVKRLRALLGEGGERS
jgi:RNA polymerase sigma-70 factor (ECF subfamily)